MVALFISLMAPLETFIGLNIGRRFSRYMAVEPLASGVPSGSGFFILYIFCFGICYFLVCSLLAVVAGAFACCVAAFCYT